METLHEMTKEAAIYERIRKIEYGDVRVLFAVEAGSRMWGFAGPDSDYDVRFVYVRKDAAFYRGFDKVGKAYPDTMQQSSVEDDLDFCGWDLPKFLQHLLALNVSVVEWCTSPIVYIDRDGFGAQVANFVRETKGYKALIPQHYGMLLSSKACGTETVKRAMYVARSILALHVLWDRKKMPRSFTWAELIAQSDLPESDVMLLEKLRNLKVTGKGSAPVPEDINAYLCQKRSGYRTDAVKQEMVSLRKECVPYAERKVLDALWARLTATS